MKYILATVIVSLLIGCNSKKVDECIIDETFKTNFNNCVEIARLRSIFGPESELDPIAVYRAFKCLEVLTGEKGQVVYEEAYYRYETEDLYNKDREIWEKWYSDNKCSMTMDKAELMFAAKRDSFPNYNDPKIMESIKDLFPENQRESARSLDSLSIVKYRISWPPLIKT